jgi:hypothetical protein
VYNPFPSKTFLEIPPGMDRFVLDLLTFGPRYSILVMPRRPHARLDATSHPSAQGVGWSLVAFQELGDRKNGSFSHALGLQVPTGATLSHFLHCTWLSELGKWSYSLVNKQFATESGHRNSWFTHSTWWFFSIVFCDGLTEGKFLAAKSPRSVAHLQINWMLLIR